MSAPIISDGKLRVVVEALESATGARKCHQCGCFQDTVRALKETSLNETIAGVLDSAAETFLPRKYDCIGCATCWPADALNFAGALVDLPVTAGCPTDAPERREGWPPVAGEFEVIRHEAPVAVCTLHSRELVGALATARPNGLSIVGAMQTENLGIERLIENVVANPNLRVLLLCGEDTPGRVGHFPGQTLLSLMQHGVDAEGRIVGAAGRRPVLTNLAASSLEHFRAHVQVLDHRGEQDVEVLISAVEAAAAEAPGPVPDVPCGAAAVTRVPAAGPPRLVLDRAGYIVVTLDRRANLLLAEHYENAGVLTTVVEGDRAIDIMATLLSRKLVSRMDHAAYVGRELAIAEHALRHGEPYVQDMAPEGEDASLNTGQQTPCCVGTNKGNSDE